MDYNKRRNFLREVHIGDEVLLSINPASSHRGIRYIRARVVGLDYYKVLIANPAKTPDKVVPEQQTDISLRNIREYQIVKNWD